MGFIQEKWTGVWCLYIKGPSKKFSKKIFEIFINSCILLIVKKF